jgi:1-acyl-sn-glycerol-3-phosphate acyltransferase
MAYFISRILYKIILKLFFKFEVTGRKNIPKKGPFIMVANHVSNADPAVMGVACHTAPITFLAKRELFDIPLFGLWFKAVGCIPIERFSGSSAPLKKVLKKLKGRGALGIFPEGRRSRDGNLQEPQPGIGIIAAKSGVPIIPMYISGSRKAFPIEALLPKPGNAVKAKIGRAVNISDAARFSDKRKAYVFIGEKIMEAIARLKNG